MIHRFFFNIAAENVEHSKAFYMDLLGMHLHFDSDWFVILKPDPSSVVEFGIIDQNSPVVPNDIGGVSAGVYSTFVVEDVDEVHARAIKLGVEISESPTDMFYGQRRMLVRDPDGLTVDISSPTAALDD